MHKKLFIAFLLSLALLCATVIPSVAFGSDGLEQFIPNFNEEELLEKYKENIRRDGDTLYIKTKANTELSLKNAPQCYTIRPCSYMFLGYIQDKGFYVVMAGYGEGTSFKMISDKDGSISDIHNVPILSPDRNRVINTSAGAPYDINGVFIWSFNGNKLAEELHYNSEERTQYYFIKWKDNKTVLLFNTESCFGTNKMAIPVTLRLEKDGWRFHDDLESKAMKCIKH
jgi:hypothetical protein